MNAKLFFLILAVTLCTFIGFAQTEIKISGTVIEDSTRHAVPFATVSVKQTATRTDINGRFILTVSAANSDSVVFSCISYESKIVPIKKFLSGEQTIVLIPKVYELGGIVIHGLVSRTIVERAIKKMPENFRADTFYQPTFYRQYHEENNKYVRLIEAAVTIENRVEKNNALKSKERVSINQLRRSDNNEQNKDEHGDHLIDLLEENPVYHSLGTVLNIKALALYKFYLDTTRSYPEQIYHIFYYSTDRSGPRFDRGEIFIDTGSFAILKFTREEFKNLYAVRGERYNSLAPYRWDFLSSKLVAEYKMQEGKMYTASLMKTYTHDLYDNKVHIKDFTVIECFELTTQNELQPKPLPLESFSDFANLYHRKYIYDSYFWNNYSAPDFYFQKSKDVKLDLEKNKNLEEQFSQNAITQQNTTACDTIYDLTENLAQYPNDFAGLADYFQKELGPVISNCIKYDDEIISSLYTLLTIDKNGNVIDAEIRRPNLTAECKDELRKKLLTMTGWTPGQLNKKPVCSHFLFPVSCINWK